MTELAQRLRPVGRLGLVTPGKPAILLAALTGAGLVHWLDE